MARRRRKHSLGSAPEDHERRARIASNEVVRHVRNSVAASQFGHCTKAFDELTQAVEQNGRIRAEHHAGASSATLPDSDLIPHAKVAFLRHCARRA